MAVLREDVVSLRFEVENDPVMQIGGEMSRMVGEVTALAGQVGGALSAAVDGLRQAGGLMMPALDFSAAQAGIAQFVAGVQSACQQAVAHVGEMGNGMQTTLGSIQLSGVGSQIMAGLLQGILSQRGAIMGAVAGIAASIKSTIASAMRIASPSREMAKLGRYIGLGLPVGMRQALPQIESAAGQMSESAAPAGQGPAAAASGGTPGAALVPPKAAAGAVVENNSYAPQFTLNLQSGQGAGDRELERKVKEWVRQSFESVVDAAQRGAATQKEV